jgi:cytochrome c oxidase cbb3-type subunit 1
MSASEQNSDHRIKLSEIDQSMKWPALFFIISATLWLLAGTALGLISSYKMHDPNFLGNWEWLTFGRTRSAHLNAVMYGWCNNAIFAVGLWIMARLCRTEIRHLGLLIVAGVFWNIAVTIGIGGIFIGDMTSVEWLEMPTYITPLLAIAYALIGVWGIIAFRYRQSEHIYVSQWYILGALFWFPWIYSVAQIMILFEPARGTVQSLTNWWFAHNVLGLWLTPMALAAAYYFIPKVIGRPIHSYYLSILGFWTLALFYNWAGVHHIVGGPVPAWVISSGIVASVMMVIPVIVTAINHHMTAIGHFRQVIESPTLRFVVFGAMSYTLVSFIGSTMSLRSVSEISHFTHLTVGHAHHGVYAFFTMIMFGSIYFILPRLLYREWPSKFLITCHFWFAALGITIMIVTLHVGGWIQGLEMNNPEIPFIEVMKGTVPWLKARTISGFFLAIAHIAFAINVFWIVFFRQGQEDVVGTPTLFSSKQAR